MTTSISESFIFSPQYFSTGGSLGKGMRILRILVIVLLFLLETSPISHLFAGVGGRCVKMGQLALSAFPPVSLHLVRRNWTFLLKRSDVCIKG